MAFSKGALKIIMLIAVLALFFPRYAFAYIDPGTGSYVFQILIAAFVAISFAVKMYWQKIKAFFGRLFSKKDK